VAGNPRRNALFGVVSEQRAVCEGLDGAKAVGYEPVSHVIPDNSEFYRENCDLGWVWKPGPWSRSPFGRRHFALIPNKLNRKRFRETGILVAVNRECGIAGVGIPDRVGTVIDDGPRPRIRACPIHTRPPTLVLDGKARLRVSRRRTRKAVHSMAREATRTPHQKFLDQQSSLSIKPHEPGGS